MRPVIDFQHIFHGGDERRAGLGRNDELLFQVRFENVFFSVRPIVLSLTRSTIFSATTLSSSRRKVHRAPFRRLRTGQGDQFRRPGAIEDARSGGGGREFVLQHGLEAFFHQLPPRPGDDRKAGVQRRSDPTIPPDLPGWRGVHLQQDARLRQLLRRVLAAVDQALQLFTLVRTELHKVLLYGDFPRDHEPAPTFIAKPSILTIYSLSMTQGTRPTSVSAKIRDFPARRPQISAASVNCAVGGVSRPVWWRY